MFAYIRQQILKWQLLGLELYMAWFLFSFFPVTSCVTEIFQLFKEKKVEHIVKKVLLYSCHKPIQISLHFLIL